MSPFRWAYAGIVLILFALVACDSIRDLPIFPTPTPSPVPSPTPTRVDETVIPFQSLASNDIAPLTADSPGGKPLLTLEGSKPAIESDWDTLTLAEPIAYVVSSVEDIEPLGVWLPIEILTTLAEVDYSVDVAIAYTLIIADTPADTHIQRVATSRADELTVYSVHYLYNYGLAAEEFPSQVIKISRDDIPFEVTSDTSIQLVIAHQQVNP